MAEIESRCLDAFPAWLQSLPDDLDAVAELADGGELPEDATRQLFGAVNYLFKSLDLIPDGIEDLGFIDDAFVLRVAAAAAKGALPAEAPDTGALERLAAEAELVREFLGDTYERLARFVQELSRSSARGRSVDAIVTDAAVRAELMSELKGWAESYVAPGFARDPKNLVKLRSFLDAKLPA